MGMTQAGRAAAVAAALSWMPGPAVALEQPAPAPLDRVTLPDEPQAALQRAARAEPDEAIETVVVTGELLTREASRTTTSVAVTSGAEIERSTARDVYAVIQATPNISRHEADFSTGIFTIRGIGSYGAGFAQSIALYSSATAVVLDGVSLPRSAMAYSDLSAFDLKQVEIFRGPQSTSQGRNAMAGAVVISTVEPEVESSFAPEARGRLAGGNRSTYQGAAAFGATLVPDRFALRIGTDHRVTDGDIDNVTLGEDGWNRDRTHNYRLRARFTPGGADGAYSVLASISQLDRLSGNRYVEQANESRREATSDEPSYIDSQSQLASLDQRLRLGEVWKLRAVTAYVRSDTHTRLDGDYTADDIAYYESQQDARGFSQELRASFDTAHWRGTFGAYYFKGRDGDDSGAGTRISAFVDAFLPGCPAAICAPLLGSVVINTDLPATIEDRAVFGEVDWSVTERLTLTAGLRVDHEKNGRVITSETRGDSPTADAAVLLLKSAGVLAQDGTVPVSRSFSAVLPKLAASYEVAQDWFLGLALAQGYRPGGGYYNYATGQRNNFDSERTDNIEVSLKGAYRPWNTQFALNLFHTEWKDMQALVGSGFATYVDNAGRSRIDGGEIEVRTRLLDSLAVFGGAGITHGRFTDFVASAGDYTGNPLPKAPHYSASLALEWTPWRSLLIRPDVIVTGSTPSQVDDTPAHQIAGYTLLNLSLRWRLGALALFVNGSNLADRNYRTDASAYGVSMIEVVALGDGRRVVGGFDFQF